MEPQVLDPLRLYSPRTVKLTFTSINQRSCKHNHSEVITVPPFSQVLRSYLMLPSWEPEGGDQSPLLPVGIGSDWGLAPGPYLILWSFLVSWSICPMSLAGARPSGQLESWSKRESGILLGGTPPCSSWSSSTPTWPSHQSGGSRASVVGISLGPQKYCRNQYLRNQAPRSESWRTQVYYACGPRGVHSKL